MNGSMTHAVLTSAIVSEGPTRNLQAYEPHALLSESEYRILQRVSARWGKFGRRGRPGLRSTAQETTQARAQVNSTRETRQIRPAGAGCEALGDEVEEASERAVVELLDHGHASRLILRGAEERRIRT